MKYFASDTYGPGWSVHHHDGQSPPIPNLTPAEAHIVAFALNAVAKGESLVSVADIDGLMTHYPFFNLYEGPTEGMKP